MRMVAPMLLLISLVTGAATAAESPVAGTWQGNLHDLPAVTLKVKEDGGKLSGTVIFYSLRRQDGHDAWTVDTKHSFPLPLINPRLEGKTLRFKVSHREAHPPRTLNDPPVPFEMRLTEENEAELKNLSEDQAEPLKMIRAK